MALAARLAASGLELVATSGTAAALSAAASRCGRCKKISEAGSPHVGELIARGEVALVVNTPRGGRGARTDGYEIRAAAIRAGIPCITTIDAAEAAAAAVAARWGAGRPRALQDGIEDGPPGTAFRPRLAAGLRLNLRPRDSLRTLHSWLSLQQA